MFRPNFSGGESEPVSVWWTILSGVGNFVNANPWPTLIAFVFVWIAVSKSTRKALATGFNMLGVKSIKASEFEIAFDTESRKAIERDIPQAYKDIEKFRDKARKSIKQIIRKTGVFGEFQKLVSEVFLEHFGDEYGRVNVKAHTEQTKQPVINARATIHIQDVVLSTRLMQLLDYYPPELAIGFGRTHSTRYGIIGRVWRSQTKSVQGWLTDKVAHQTNSKSEDELINSVQLEWGLDRKEAVEIMKRPSYFAVPIESENHDVIAVFYMDSEAPNFGWDETVASVEMSALENVFDNKLKQCGLAKSLTEFEKEIVPFSPRLQEEE